MGRQNVGSEMHNTPKRGTPGAEARHERLAAALRANLKKRKAQEKARVVQQSALAARKAGEDKAPQR